MSNSLINRLRGQYEVGENNEFGTRSFADFIPPVALEAANKIETLEQILNEAMLELESWNLQSGDDKTNNFIKRISKILYT